MTATRGTGRPPLLCAQQQAGMEKRIDGWKNGWMELLSREIGKGKDIFREKVLGLDFFFQHYVKKSSKETKH